MNIREKKLRGNHFCVKSGPPRASSENRLGYDVEFLPIHNTPYDGKGDDEETDGGNGSASPRRLRLRKGEPFLATRTVPLPVF